MLSIGSQIHDLFISFIHDVTSLINWQGQLGPFLSEKCSLFWCSIFFTVHESSNLMEKRYILQTIILCL